MSTGGSERVAMAWSFLVVATALVAGSAGAAGVQEAGCAIELPTNGTVAPGEQLADVVGDQESAVESELSDRGFEARLANATTNETRAAVIADELDRIDARLRDLEGCPAAFSEAVDSGEIGEDTYRRAVRALGVRVDALDERLNETRTEAAKLPPSAREERGINESVFAEFRTRVEDLEEFVTESSGG